MRTFTHFPPQDLAPYVDRLWGWESEGDETIPLPTLLPGTGAELYFHYGQPFEYGPISNRRSERGHLLCLRRAPLELQQAQGLGFIAVRFRAGMLYRFLDIPGAELIDSAESAENIWGTEGKLTVARVADAATHPERISLIVEFLRSQLRDVARDDVAEAAIASLYDTSSISIENLAAQLHLGRRQLEKRFSSLTGQRPSEFRRLVRFQKTVRALMLASDIETVDTALAHGYYDQSHFIRDFKSFAQSSPLAYLAKAKHKTHFYNTSRTGFEKMASPATSIERKVRANAVRRT